MAKIKSAYTCSQCGYVTPKWMGKCPNCNAWNSLEESEVIQPKTIEKKIRRAPGNDTAALRIDDILQENITRCSSGIQELDRVLGGGIVDGSVILVGGDPGIGKSTLLTQVCANIASKGISVLYVSGEESARQMKLRALRMGVGSSGFYVLAENDLDLIEKRIFEINPSVVVIDSIQTMYKTEISSVQGSITQVRECAAQLTRLAKTTGCSLFLVGHVTKEGAIAGPRILEHMVDAVLYFEGDHQHQYRMLRAVKNRFGSINELGMFEMESDGMHGVSNPSEVLLSGRALNASGCVVMPTIEGTRPLLLDVQALVASTSYGNPRRMGSGVDQGRLALLLAVLEKRAGYRLYDKDVYINIAGGMTLTEPASDLAVCLAVASSFHNRPVAPECVVIGEIGLAGEVRSVPLCDRRINESIRLGFSKIILPKADARRIKNTERAEVYGVDTLQQALALAELQVPRRGNI